jgi:hypothetical protein
LIPATLIIVTIDGEDAQAVAVHVEGELRDMAESGEWTFGWQVETVEVTGKPVTKECPWWK